MIPTEGFPILDFHAYLGSDAYGDFSQPSDLLIRRMAEHSITRTVVAPMVDSPGFRADCHAEMLASIACERDRLIPFARLDPRYGATAIDELRRLVREDGFEGLLFDPASCQTLPYHPGVLPLLECAAVLPIPVLIPAGDAGFSLPEQIGLLARTLPNLVIVLGHMGTAFHAQRAIDVAAQHPNLYLETSLQQSPQRIAYAVKAVGADRILFGSAAPYGDVQTELIKIQRAGLAPSEQRAILGLNAIHLMQSFKERRDGHDH